MWISPSAIKSRQIDAELPAAGKWGGEAAAERFDARFIQSELLDDATEKPEVIRRDEAEAQTQTGGEKALHGPDGNVLGVLKRGGQRHAAATVDFCHDGLEVDEQKVVPVVLERGIGVRFMVLFQRREDDFAVEHLENLALEFVFVIPAGDAERPDQLHFGRRISAQEKRAAALRCADA